MNNKIIKIPLLILFLISIFLITKYYFSEKNMILTNKSRLSFLTSLDRKDLLILKSDTDNIIIYRNDLEDFKKNRKKRFWEKLISNND